MEKDFFIVVLLMMATLLGFSSVSSLNILPRVTRTNDAVIIDCKVYFLFHNLNIN